MNKEQNTKLDNLKNYTKILFDNLENEISMFLYDTLTIFSILISQYFYIIYVKYYWEYLQTGIKPKIYFNFFSKELLIPFVFVLFLSLNFFAIKKVRSIFLNLYILPLLFNKYFSVIGDEKSLNFSYSSYFKDIKLLKDKLPFEYKNKLWSLNKKRDLKSIFIISIFSQLPLYFSLWYYDLNSSLEAFGTEFFDIIIFSWLAGFILTFILILLFQLFFIPLFSSIFKNIISIFITEKSYEDELMEIIDKLDLENNLNENERNSNTNNKNNP